MLKKKTKESLKNIFLHSLHYRRFSHANTKFSLNAVVSSLNSTVGTVNEQRLSQKVSKKRCWAGYRF